MKSYEIRICPKCNNKLILCTTMPKPTYLCPHNGKGCYHAELKDKIQ